MNPKLLLITDRADRAQIQAKMLVSSGLDVSVLNHILAQNIMSAAALEGYELILLNLYDEENHCIEICRKLRAEYYNPILALIYERDERFLLRVYEAGADDCLVQPLSIHILLAKVRVWLRRAAIKDKSPGFLEAYKFRLNPSTSELTTPEGNLIRLSQLEARLLHLLIVNSGRTVSTDMIIQRVWPDNGMHVDRYLLKALVHRLRRKIGSNPTHPQYIQTVPYQGYSFRPQ